MTKTTFDVALASFDAAAFIKKHGGSKESNTGYSYEWLIRCPLCGSSRLRFNTRKRMGTCWGCGTGFDVVKLVQVLEKTTIEGVVDVILDGYVGGDNKLDKLESVLALKTSQAAHHEFKTLKRLPAIPWPKGVDLLTAPCAAHARAWQYLAYRGITSEMVREFGLGFGRDGRLKDFIVFPVYMDRALVYYQGRATWDPPAHLTGSDRRAWIDETKYIKTCNPFNREGQAAGHDVLFNYDRASVQEHIVICEGPIDALKVGPHAVALLGKEPTPAKVERLIRASAFTYTVYLDRGVPDKKGRLIEREKAEALASELSGFADVFIATPPEGYDPGALTREQNAYVIANAVPWKSRLLSSNLKT